MKVDLGATTPKSSKESQNKLKKREKNESPTKKGETSAKKSKKPVKVASRLHYQRLQFLLVF